MCSTCARLDAGHLEQRGEYSRVRFGCARRDRGDVAGEQIRDAAAVADPRCRC